MPTIDIEKKKFEDTKGVIRSHKSNNRQRNGQKKKDKRTNNDLQITTQKTKIQTHLKTGVNSSAQEGYLLLI